PCKESPMTLTVDDLLAAARRRIRRLDPQEAARAHAQGALLIDIRPTLQRRWEGEIPGAVAVERNVLEWRLDPASAHRLADITDHHREVIVVCSEGYASSLVAAPLVDSATPRRLTSPAASRPRRRRGSPS